MSLANHLVIFVKAPRLGRVKTRLEGELGPMGAWRFYRHMTERLLRRVGGDQRWRTWLAVTPDAFVNRGRFWPNRFERIAQGTGDLGARMARPMRALPRGPVVIVGSDIPAIERRHIAEAFRLLGSRDVVLGPAADGGYWLVGLRRRPVMLELFAAVEWSGPRVLEQTLAKLSPRAKVVLLEELDDVDGPEAYARWKARAML
ncbi:MAG: TIGR04282 family arsenosugar biosynthesis glycosyltransferase [Proteobacteria bacterium]|nr:TIGR04282 family arsenosugar biosynthesis glycosyltransferase [Pseudomonadota bacterium]